MIFTVPRFLIFGLALAGTGLSYPSDEIAHARGCAGVDSICVFQVITTSQLAASERNGGNALGLHREDGPLFLFNVVLGWENAADDARMERLVQTVIDRATEYGKSQGADLDFKYMNYAGPFQDVITGYGADSKARLISIAEKYDEEGVFQNLQPGWFKLSGPPSHRK